MANAPTPGSKRRKRQGFRVTLYGQVYELQTRDIGPADEGLVRQTTGRPLSGYLQEFGLDSLAVIVWMARRKQGEKKLTLAKVFESFPSYDEFNEMTEDGRADFEVLEDVTEHTDEDGVIDGESVEVDTHPLPHAAS